MDYRFDADSHRYWINEREVPSVTRVLADLIPGWKASEWYLERGQAVHAAAAFIAKGIDFECDARIAGQVTAVRRFFAEVKPVVLAVELKVYSHTYQYAGTLDLAASIPTTKTAPVPIIWDYKASLTPATPYQMAAYSQSLKETKGQNVDRGIGVEIREDGTYHMSEVYDLKRYRQKWLTLLGAYHIRRECGIKEETQGETQ